jgi:hypothetical protein
MVEAKKQIIAVDDFISPDLPRYYCVLRLQKVENGEFHCLVNFASDEAALEPVLQKLKGSVRRIHYSNGQVIITITYNRLVPPSAVFNAMVQAQVNGILPK